MVVPLKLYTSSHRHACIPTNNYEYFIYRLRAHRIRYIVRKLWLQSDGGQGSDLKDSRILKFLDLNCTLMYKTLNNSGGWYEIYEVNA